MMKLHERFIINKTELQVTQMPAKLGSEEKK